MKKSKSRKFKDSRSIHGYYDEDDFFYGDYENRSQSYKKIKRKKPSHKEWEEQPKRFR